MVFLWWRAVLILCQTYLLELWPKISPLVSSDHKTFSHMLLGDLCVFPKLAWMFFLPPYPIVQTYEEYGRLMSYVLHSQYLPEIPAVVCCCRRLGSKPDQLSYHLFIILEGHPVLGNTTVAPYFLHLMMTVFTVFHGISNAMEIILYTSPDLIPFNNEIPLMLWKPSADHGFCCKMRLRKCLEKPTRTAKLYLGLIRGTLNDGRCVPTPI